MAGIYDQFDGEDRFVILTAEANASMAAGRGTVSSFV